MTTQTKGQLYWDDVREGQEVPTLKKHCTSQQLVFWAAGSGDYYQIHYDKDFAQSTGLPGIIVHGALKNGFLGQLLSDWIGYEGRIKKYGCSYRGMDPAEQDILVKGVVTKKYEQGGEYLLDLDVWTENPQGQKTTPGTATVRLPKK